MYILWSVYIISEKEIDRNDMINVIN